MSRLPVQRFSPGRGLVVERKATEVIITGTMEMHGPEATADRAKSVQDTINTTWTVNFSDGHSFKCNITVRYRGPGTSPGKATQIKAEKISGPSNVARGLSGDPVMTLNANNPTAFTNAAS